MNEKDALYLNSLKSGELVLFCGANISKNSGFPLANEIKQCILEKLSIEKKDIDEIMNSNLPFEVFMEIISENIDISKILEIFEKGDPNTNHILIARLAKNGYVKRIFTTNFDLLIEKALEKEGLKKDKDFEVYCDEEEFSKINLEIENKKIRIFKLHGSVDNKDSIRITMKAVASKILSDKRMKIIRYLFSTGKHKKVLILGYSCSDEFDITPQIQSIEENQKEIIFIEHSNEKEEIEDIGIKEEKNPFKAFPGIRIKYNTDDFIEDVWKCIFNEECKKSIKPKIDWEKYLDEWAKGLKEGLGYFIGSSMLREISNFKKAIEYYEKSLKMIGNKKGESRCYTNLGIAYDGLGNFKKAIEYYEKSLEIDKEIGDKVEKSKCYTGLGNVYNNLGDFKKAIKYYKKSLEIVEVIEDIAGKSKCYTGLGNVYNKLEDFNKAIEYYEKSLEINEEIGDKTGESRCYTNLGVAYDGLGDFNKAIEYHEKSLKIAKVIEDKVRELKCYTNLGNVYNNLGNVYNNLEDFKKAIEYYKKSLEIVEVIEDIAGKSKCYTGLGNVYNNLGDFKKAIEYYEKSLEIDKEIGDKVEKSKCYTGLGNVYNNLGDFKKAIEYYEKSLEINKAIRDKAGESKCYTNLGNVYDDVGDFEKAIEYYSNCLKLNPEHVEAWYKKGLVNVKLKQYEEATQCNDKALNINPELNPIAILQIYKFLKSHIENENNQNDVINLTEKFHFIINEIENFKTKLYEQDKTSPDRFVHYTKPYVIKSLIKEDSYFRFYCTKYMNDPDEGKILCTIDKTLKKFYKHEKNEEDDFLTFIGSFMSYKKGKDKLPLWRFYGKGDDNKDAKGMCIVLDKSFFDHNKSPQLDALPILEESNKKSSKKDINIKLILNIYPVIYIDTINKNELITELLSEIKEPLKDITSDELYKSYKKFVKVAVRTIIDEIRYLFKSMHYKEEDEYRVVITLMKDDKRILIDNSGDDPKFYIDIKKKFKSHLKEIIIGPAVKHKNEWKAYFISNGIEDTKIKFSECRFN